MNWKPFEQFQRAAWKLCVVAVAHASDDLKELCGDANVRLRCFILVMMIPIVWLGFVESIFKPSKLANGVKYIYIYFFLPVLAGNKHLFPLTDCVIDPQLVCVWDWRASSLCGTEGDVWPMVYWWNKKSPTQTWRPRPSHLVMNESCSEAQTATLSICVMASLENRHVHRRLECGRVCLVICHF